MTRVLIATIVAWHGLMMDLIECRAEPQTAPEREIKVVTKTPLVELGDEIPITVRFSNAGADPWVLLTPEHSPWVGIRCAVRGHAFEGREPPSDDNPSLFEQGWTLETTRRITAKLPNGVEFRLIRNLRA